MHTCKHKHISIYTFTNIHMWDLSYPCIHSYIFRVIWAHFVSLGKSIFTGLFSYHLLCVLFILSWGDACGLTKLTNLNIDPVLYDTGRIISEFLLKREPRERESLCTSSPSSPLPPDSCLQISWLSASFLCSTPFPIRVTLPLIKLVSR